MIRALLVAVCGCVVAWGLTPSQVVVVYNAGSKRSEQCARAYCACRSVPVKQCIGLSGLPKGQDISRQEYDSKLRYPLLLAAQQNSWRLPAASNQGLKPVAAMVDASS